jgi:hypothetical protein
MTLTRTTTPYGAAAYRALIAAVHAAKDGDPLKPVTVVVATELVGVAARRALARGDGRPGIAALSVVTLRRLAEIIAGRDVAGDGRRPLTETKLAGTIRSLLAEQPGEFEKVADRIGTVRALATAHRELRALDDRELDALGDGERVVAETVRVHRELEARCTDTAFDEVDLLEAATVRADRVRHAVVVFLPSDLDAPEQAFLDALGEATTVDQIIGDANDDAGREPVAARVVHASDADDEVRGVVREVVAALHSGTPGHRISIFYGTADPYARLLHEHLRRAEVAFAGRGVRSVLDGRFGRGLLRLLRLPEHDFRRDEVLGWITDAPVRWRGATVHSSPWERVSRAAGVVSAQHWARLAEHAAERRRHAETESAAAEPRAWVIERDERTANTATELLEFVENLIARFERIKAATTWHDLGSEAMSMWTELLAGSPGNDEDARAVARITAALQAITDLGADGGHPDLRTLRELLELQLADNVDRVGVTGVGVQVGPVSDGAGAECDLVFVLGAAEGTLPARRSDDPLLPDRIRRGTGLPTLREQSHRCHHQFLASLGAAPPTGRIVTFPRGDLRSGGTRMPSRWLEPSLRAISGNAQLTIAKWEDAGCEEWPSYAGELARTTTLATAQEWRQRAAAVACADGTEPPADAGGAATGRARATRAARRFGRFAAHTGNLIGEDLPDPTSGRPVSATALQSWATCPDDYFLRYLLGISPIVQPEDVVQISALDQGTVLHDILDKLTRRALDEGWAPGHGEPWPDRALTVLDELADDRFAQAEREGVTGFACLWERDREALRTDLHTWLGRDDERRAPGGLAPEAAEWAFGHHGGPDTALDLGDGRALRLRGSIDRIDRTREGRLVVTDYKSGGAGSYADLSPANPCDGGKKLQLPIYALAARTGLAPRSREPVVSSFWFTSRKGGFREIGYPVDDQLMATATDTVRAIVDGITRGVFPSRPSGRSAPWPGQAAPSFRCHACDPDGLGEGGVDARWKRLVEDETLADPALRAVRELLFGVCVDHDGEVDQ